MQTPHEIIYGKHAVLEALLVRPDIVRCVLLSEPGVPSEVGAHAKKHSIPLKEFNPKKLPKGVPNDALHQGVIAEIDTRALIVPFETFIEAESITNDTAYVLLGEIQDPHNVGAIIRSAVAFGIRAILIPEHRQVQVNGTVIKVSAGMAFRIPLVRIGNVNTTVRGLKERGFWTYGLEGSAQQSVTEEQFEKPSVLIVGNEGEGIRTKTLAHCDIPLRIPMSQSAESLNASVATAVVMYAWSTRHPKAISR